MNIKEITSQSVWTTFFNVAGSPSFLHSWEWGEFQSKLGYSPIRLGMYEGDQLIAIALVIKIKAKRGNMLFIPHGPLIVIPSKEGIQSQIILDKLIQYLKEIAKREGYSFIRVA